MQNGEAIAMLPTIGYPQKRNGRRLPAVETDNISWGNQWQAEATNAVQTERSHISTGGEFPLSRSVSGIEDMAGNVFEYTSTLQHQPSSQQKGQEVTVMKGCSWDDLPGFCRGAYRHTRPTHSRHILFGFRLLRVR